MIARLKSAVAAANRRLATRHAIRGLDALDARVLRDIGIHHGDLRRTALGIDPRY